MTALAPPHVPVLKAILALPSGVLDTFADKVDPNPGRLIFRDAMLIDLVTTGKRAVVITTQPGGSVTMPTTAFSQTINVRCYCDHTRDVNGVPAIENGLDKAWDAWSKIDHYLHNGEFLIQTPHFIFMERQGPPSDFFDQQLSLPYVSCNYDTAIMGPSV